MKKLLTAFFFLIILNLTGLAQKSFDPGYVVTSNFDTLRGFIKLQSNYLNSQTCVFMRSGDAVPRTYSPMELRSYRIQDKKYYVSNEVTVDSVKKTLFLEYLVHGIADLYYLKEQAQEYYFLDKAGVMTPLNNNGRTITVTENEGKADEKIKTYYQPSLQYKRMMTVLFQDSPEILDRIKTLNYDYRSLINITVAYHNQVCKDQVCINYTKSTSQHIFIEPWAGYKMEWMGFKKSTDIVASNTFIAGFNLRIKPFKGYSNWDLLIGLGYSTSNFNGDISTSMYEAATPGYKFLYRIHADYKMFQLPITAEYTFPTKKLRPFLAFSVINGYAPDPVVSTLRIDQFLVKERQLFFKYQISGVASFGLKFFMTNGSYIFLRNEIEYRRAGRNAGWLWDNTHEYAYRLTLGLGIRLK